MIETAIYSDSNGTIKICLEVVLHYLQNSSNFILNLLSIILFDNSQECKKIFKYDKTKNCRENHITNDIKWLDEEALSIILPKQKQSKTQILQDKMKSSGFTVRR